MDNGDVPNTQVAIYDYDGIPVIFESRALPENPGSENMDALIRLSLKAGLIVSTKAGQIRCCSLKSLIQFITYPKSMTPML